MRHRQPVPVLRPVPDAYVSWHLVKQIVLPLDPAVSSTVPKLAAIPIQIVEISGPDQLHGIVYRQAGTNNSTGAVDIKADILIGIFPIQIKKLRDNQVSNLVVDSRAKKDNPFSEQQRIDIIGTFAARTALGDHRDDV